MNNNKILLVMLAVLSLNFTVLGENLLQDMDFIKLNTIETDWKRYYGGKGFIRKNVSVEGRKALLLDSGGTGDAGGVTQVIECIEPNKFYRAEVSAQKVTSKNSEGSFFQLRFLLSNKKIKVFQIPLNPRSESNFEKFFIEAKAPEDTIKAQLFIYIHRNKNAAVILTDVTFERVDSKQENIVIKKASYKHLPQCPEIIPDDWLKPEQHPRIFCNREELNIAREKIKSTDYGRKYLEQQTKFCSEIINMEDKQLRALVPKPGSLIVYGLGMNTCPQGQRLRWGGVKNPFTVYGKDNILYPNDNFPDNGCGWIDNETGNKFLFIANANGFIHKYLEQTILPALADVYALTSEKKYAHTAAVLLDAIAAAYPENYRGPLDYPTDRSNYDRGGRLDRPYYQTARGLYNYVNTIDLIASSGELEKKSFSSKEKGIRENIIRNLLWNGAIYCLDFTLKGTQLHNGHADYMRGAAMVGIILNQRILAEPMLKGTLSMLSMLDVNIDRNGFYVETSPSYGIHTAQLYHVIAELFEAAKNLGWKDIPSIYNSPILDHFLSEFFNRREVGGHIPTIGDDGPDRFFHSPLRRRPLEKYVLSDRYLGSQINNAWIMLVRGKGLKQRSRAAAIIRNTFGNEKIIHPNDRWAIYHINQEHITMIEKIKEVPDFFDSNSIFYGAKGLALLRGGIGEKRFGCQLLFGTQNNHGQRESLSWTFFDRGVEWSYDPGYFNTHYRFGWTSESVAHQMVTVNAESYDVSDGGGFMTAWLDSPAIQWVSAKHPDAYSKQDIKRYERFIAQVVNPENGRLGYWLDVSRVEGGKFRDDSFHTAMIDAEVSVGLTPMKEFSLYGDMYKGCSFLDDYRLDKFKEKPFYWHPPGNGYGFLTHPRQTIMAGPIHIVFKNPGFKSLENSNTAISVDFPGKLGRDFIVANSFKVRGAPSVPYVIRRDSGVAPSIFAKIIRTFNKDTVDHIIKVEDVKIEKGPAIARSYLITWRNGLSDLWIISEKGMNVTVAPKNLPKVHCDGLVAMVRFDKTSKSVLMNASSASFLEVDGQKKVIAMAEAKGQIEDILWTGDNVAFKINWSGSKDFISSGQPLITAPEKGQSVTWRIVAVDDIVTVEGVKPTIGTSLFIPCAQKPGWYSLTPLLSRFYGPGSKINKNFVIGKKVYSDNKIIGVITDATKYEVKLENVGALVTSEEFTGLVLESVVGDKFTIPLNLHWQYK